MSCKNDFMLLAIKAAAMMIENGGETYRAEECCISILNGCGAREVNVITLPTAVVATAEIDGEMRTECASVKNRTINLTMIDRINAVSRRIAMCEITVEQGFDILENRKTDEGMRPIVRALLFSFAAGSFAVIFGGGFSEFVAAYFAAFFCRYFIQFVEKITNYNFLSTLGGSMIIAVCARIAAAASNTIEVEPIIIGAIMPLVPGLAMTNALRDTINGDLISGLSRGVETLICAVAIASGVAIVLSV